MGQWSLAQRKPLPRNTGPRCTRSNLCTHRGFVLFRQEAQSLEHRFSVRRGNHVTAHRGGSDAVVMGERSTWSPT